MPEPRLRLLHVQASPRGDLSRSQAVVQRLISGMVGFDVETLDLFAIDLPAFDGATIEGRYALITGEPVAPDVVEDWAAIRALVDYFLSFDGWLFSVPTWNFGIPYRLKHYIDLLTQPGMAFSVDPAAGIIGHAAGRMAIIVGSGALEVRPGAPLDHHIAYLQDWLGFIGVTDIHAIRLCPTYGPSDEVAVTMTAAYAEADALAASLSRPARV
jgi:FMN-dependent NADH-azoreductase